MPEIRRKLRRKTTVKIGGIMTEITLSELAEKSGGNYDTLYRKAKRNFPEISWTKDSPVSADQIRLLSGKKRKAPRLTQKRIAQDFELMSAGQEIAKPIVVNKPEPAVEPVPPARQKIGLDDVRRFLVSAILIGIVLCHAGLIWYDCSTLWETAGQIGGGAVFLVVVAAVMLAADREQYYTSESALWFVLLIDIAAWWVHFPVFRTPLVSDTITGALCAFLCACSWIALYLYRLKNTQ